MNIRNEALMFTATTLEGKVSNLTGMIPPPKSGISEIKDGGPVRHQLGTLPPPLYWKTLKNFQVFEGIYNKSTTHWGHEHTIGYHNLKKYLNPSFKK